MQTRGYLKWNTVAFSLLVFSHCGERADNFILVDDLEFTPAKCSDGLDNDDDGLVDCDDLDCQGYYFCREEEDSQDGLLEQDSVMDSELPPDWEDTYTGEPSDNWEVFSEHCQDGEDNDGDGLTDCDDEGCRGYTFCQEQDTETDTDNLLNSCPFECMPKSVCIVMDGIVHEAYDCSETTSVCCYAGEITDVDAGTDEKDECLIGNVTIENSLDVALIKPFSCIDGSLKIETVQTLESIRLPNLVSVTGKLSIEQTHLNIFSADKLASVGAFIFTDKAMTELVLDRLSSVRGDFSVTASTLKELSLKKLKTVDGYFWITQNTQLKKMNISSLAEVGGDFSIDNNDSLSCDAEELQSQISVGGDIYICGNAPDSECGEKECAWQK